MEILFNTEIITEHLPNDYILIKHYKYLCKNRIEVGITDFSKAGQSVEMELQLGKLIFKRISTGVIPDNLAGHICTCQVYELNKIS